jgi:hypothetical protein
VGRQFTDGNSIYYVINEQFQVEVTRTIRQARDYHVLWIHDFRGRNDEGTPDKLSLRYVVDAYLRALTDAVRAYDARGVLPLYMIFLDQHYYEENDGRLWLDLLERPLEVVPKLPAGFEDFAARLAIARDSLRAAVAGSRLLAAESRQYGSAWLGNQVKVHVSITNQADPSFWGREIIPVVGIPDDFMRDHRKIAFFDVSEEDPFRGQAIYTGMGIGEHYAGPTWEDRSIIAQGPLLLTLKAEARQLLLGQGLSAEQIPYPLRPRALPEDSGGSGGDPEAARQGASRPARLELHNGTGTPTNRSMSRRSSALDAAGLDHQGARFLWEAICSLPFWWEARFAACASS